MTLRRQSVAADLTLATFLTGLGNPQSGWIRCLGHIRQHSVVRGFVLEAA